MPWIAEIEHDLGGPILGTARKERTMLDGNRRSIMERVAAPRLPVIYQWLSLRICQVRVLHSSPHSDQWPMPSIEHLIRAYGLIVVAGITGFESVGLPVPGETVLIVRALS